MINYSSESLPVYNSTSQLSSRFQDLFNVIVIPSLISILFLLKIASIWSLVVIVRKNRKEKKKTLNMFYYMLAYEIGDLLQGIFATMGALFRCGSYCEMGYDFMVKVFDLALYTYGNIVIQQAQTFLEISFALERLEAFKKIGNKKKLNFSIKLLIIIIAAAIVGSLNTIITRTVMPIGTLRDSRILYQVTTNEFARNNAYWTIALLLVGLVRGFLLNIVLCILNVVIFLKLKSYITENQRKLENGGGFKKKKKLENSTKLLLAINTNYVLGNIPESLSQFLFVLLGSNSIFYNYYYLTASIIMIFSHFLYIIIYYKYNHTFKKIILETFIQKKI